MPKALVTYLSQRSDASAFLLPAHMGRTLEDLFQSPERLPQPTRIYPADETQPPVLGFPLAESPVMKDLDAKLDRWLGDEVAWLVGRANDARERAQSSWTTYVTQLLKVAENAMMSNLLSDYHGVFWLAHSVDLARQFSSIPRRVSAINTEAGRTQGDSLKYRIFTRWATETREQMTQIAAKAASILDGDEQRAFQFFRLLQDDVLILTEEFVGPDLRELRSFVTGYLRRDYQALRDSIERFRMTVADLAQREATFRSVLPLFTGNGADITIALLFDAKFQAFAFELPSVQNALSREDREQIHLIGRRVREFAVLNQLRRGILWLATSPEGEIIAADRRSATRYSRSTRPLDFGKPGVVDPMVHRFGLIYDISKFTETLGNLRRAGGKEEIRSYRQMLLFQRRLESIASRHKLQFEKFLGDGAFYTTRRAMGLVRAAIEIQRYYSEMKRKGFAFNRGLRVAVNYGYYRLLPLKTSQDTNEKITEFYGPGIVELSRLTTGKADKEIDEIGSFLIAHGYDAAKVQAFFAPLARGVDVIDHAQHAREFYAYVNANGHLMNEGIVASIAFLQELSAEAAAEGLQLQRLKTSFGTFIGFAPSLHEVEFAGVRLLGMVQLKGLDDIDVGEIVPFAQGEAEATPIESSESLFALLRQEYHQHTGEHGPFDLSEQERASTTTERTVGSEIVICVRPSSEPNDEVVIGEWDPLSDDLRRPLRIPRRDFDKLFAFSADAGVTFETLTQKKGSVLDLYHRLSDRSFEPSVQLSAYRHAESYEAYVLGDVVEKL